MNWECKYHFNILSKIIAEYRKLNLFFKHALESSFVLNKLREKKDGHGQTSIKQGHWAGESTLIAVCRVPVVCASTSA